MTTHKRICPLCEACCGLEIDLEGPAGAETVVAIRGDDADVFSKGYICPKGAALGELHADPDRLKAPLVKRDGAFVEVTWDEAFAEIAKRLPHVRSYVIRDGRLFLSMTADGGTFELEPVP